MTREVMNTSVEVAPDRFGTPLYSIAEAARYLDVPASTFATWARGYRRTRPGRPTAVGRPIVTALGRPGDRGAVVPFIGLAEAVVLSAMRQSGVPLQRIRPALDELARTVGVEHALASERLYTDGAEILYDYAGITKNADVALAARELVVVRNGQRVFNEIVASYLRRVEFAKDGYARRIQLPAYQRAMVIADPGRGFGQPVFAHGGARLEDILNMFQAGEPIAVVADEYGVPRDEVEDAIRVAMQVAA
jgi:uncharacterized protein (DUF433 family)